METQLNLQEHLDCYSKYLSSSKNYSPHSVKSYLSDLTSFKQFYRNQPGDWTQREYLTLFLKQFFKKNYSNSSIYRYRSSLSSFFDYLVKQKVISTSPTKLLGRYKRKRTLPQIWSQEKITEVIKRLNSFQSTGKGRYREYRDLLITEMLYGLGLRISELTHIKVNDIDFQQNMVMIRGKGGHYQFLPLTPRLVEEIQFYLSIRENFLKQLGRKKHDYLFCSYQGPPLTVRGVRYAFQSRIHSRGIDRIHPHALRHSLAGHLLENGAGIRQVQKVLRHRSIASTQKYTQISSQFLKKEHQQRHPLNQNF